LDIFLHEIANQVQQIQAHDFIFWWGHKVSQGPFTSYHMIYRSKNFPVYLSFVKLPRIHSPYFILYTHFSNYKIFITSPPENSFSSAISDDVHIQIFPEASFEELLQKHHAEIKFLKTFYKTRAITFNSTEEEKELTLKFYKRLTREGRIFRYILLRQLFRRKICKLTYRKPIHEQPFFS
jgi:hypothetical protein